MVVTLVVTGASGRIMRGGYKMEEFKTWVEPKMKIHFYVL